jgi:DNA-binding MarR family transcriptional regulator
MSEPTLLELLENIRSRCREREIRLRSRLGLSISHYRGLSRLGENEIVTCRELARRLALSPSRASRVIEGLVRDGLLSRDGCASDRRCKRLRLTPRGQSLRRRIDEEGRACESRITAALAGEEISRLKSGLQRLATSFESRVSP